MTHVERERAAINGELHRSKRAQRFEFAAPRQERGGRKREVTVANRHAITHAVIERLHAEAIAHEPEHALSSIKQRDSKHASEASDRALNAPCFKRCKHDFSVAVTAPTVANCRQFVAQLCVVVNLTVERDFESSTCRTHRLMTSRREIENR